MKTYIVFLCGHVFNKRILIHNSIFCKDNETIITLVNNI